MRQIVCYLMVILSMVGVSEVKGIIPQAYKNPAIEDENQIYCFYGQQLLPMEILDNSTSEYSSVWENVVRVISPISAGWGGGGIVGKLYIPESISYEGIEYKVIGIDEYFGGQRIIGFEYVSLPYEMTSIGDGAFEADSEGDGWFDEIDLPVALRYVGDGAFRNQTSLQQVRIFSPLPPICLSSEGRDLKVGDKLSDGEEGPFVGISDESRLVIPMGFGFFYTSHPAFAEFKEIAVGYRAPWVSYNFKLSWGSLDLVYLGNGEMMVYSVHVYGNTDNITIPATVEAGGITCSVIGIGTDVFGPLNVKEIVMPETISFIGDRAFNGTHIEEITLPENCLYLGHNVFNNNSNLKRINLRATEKMVVADDAFSYLPKDVELYVGSEIDETQLPWSRFKTIHKTSAGVEAVTVETGNSVTYNLQGMPVKELRPGEIYICNGKKFVAQ